MSPVASVAAVVPTFRPGTDVLPHVKELLAQCGRVVVVDDGSGPGADEVLAAVAAQGAEVVRLERNRGIAAALNAGITHALVDPGTAFVLTIDQDSEPCGGYVEAAVRRAASRPADQVGMVVPATVAGAPVPVAGDVDGETNPLEPIQSGMLIPRATFDKVGMFREEFVIDGVDSEFFLRTRAAGLLALMCDECSIAHELGVLTPSLPWRQGFSYHSPTRRFYMTRNRLTLFQEYRRGDPEWFRRIARAELMGLTITLVFGAHRLKQVRAVLAGVSAYRRRRYGLVPERVRARLELPRVRP